MTKVICSMSTSLDGYIVGPDGGFDWSAPDEAVFEYATEEVRRLKVHFLGRRLYEAMSYWELPEAGDESQTVLEQEFAQLWRALPKVVFSTTLTAVAGTNIALAYDSVADEVARWRADPDRGDIAIGGADLLASAALDDLVDEYRVRVYPVLVGGGTPLFPQDEQRVDLELLGVRTFDNGVVAMHHRVLR